MGIFDLGACKPGSRARMDSRTGTITPPQQVMIMCEMSEKFVEI